MIMSDKIFVKNNIDGNIILEGKIDSILTNRRAYRLLKDFSKFTVEDNKIVFSIGSDFAKTLTRIKNVAKIVGLIVEYSDDISDEVKDFKLEEEKFEEFSRKALSIRNNDCEITDFKRFEESLIENMPNRTLYPLQMLSAFHLAFSQNACNFSVPGAGKTSVVYGAYTYLKNLEDDDIKKVDKLLIIGPLSSFGPWEDEYSACFGKKADAKRLVSGMTSDAKKDYLYSFSPSEITLLSYAGVPTLVEELIHFLTKNRVMVVLDEAHKIKNSSGGITAESVLRLAEKSRARVVLTGTPAPNGYEDLLNLFKFIWPTKNIIKYQVGQLKDMSKNDSDARVQPLLESLEPFFIRVRKSDLGIPQAINNPPIIVKMHDNQRKIYDLIEGKYITDIATNKDLETKRFVVKARLIRLMQAATNPELLRQPLADFAVNEGIDLSVVDEDDAFISQLLSNIKEEVPAKFEKCVELIKDIVGRGEKVVIWACYIKTIEQLTSYFDKCGINSRALYGATPVATDGMSEEDEGYELTREAIIREFHKDNSEFSVIIANPFAVAESISLHKVCHNAIYLERSFNCAHFIQSKDRIHRYGLRPDIKTNYYYLVSEDSIDTVIDERLHDKEQRLLDIIENMPIPLFDNVLDGAGDEDIKAVLREYARRTKEM